VERWMDPVIALRQFQFIGIFAPNSNHSKRAKELVSQLFGCSSHAYVTRRQHDFIPYSVRSAFSVPIVIFLYCLLSLLLCVFAYVNSIM
jgi:hypothetical protein